MTGFRIGPHVSVWPTRPASFTVRCLTDPSPEQLEAIADYTKRRIRRWDDPSYPLPETHVVAGVHVEVERRPGEDDQLSGREQWR